MERYYRHRNPLIWDQVFPVSSTAHCGVGEDLVQKGDEVTRIYLVDSGAFVETQSDRTATSHAVNFAGPGSLFGARMTCRGSGVHDVRITALTQSTVRFLPREQFVSMTMHDPELAAAVLRDLVRRTETAQRLADCAEAPSTRRHVLDLLRLVHETFGCSADGRSNVSIPPALLERILGVPWLLIRKALTDMLVHGQVEVTGSGVFLRNLFS